MRDNNCRIAAPWSVPHRSPHWCLISIVSLHWSCIQYKPSSPPSPRWLRTAHRVTDLRTPSKPRSSGTLQMLSLRFALVSLSHAIYSSEVACTALKLNRTESESSRAPEFRAVLPPLLLSFCSPSERQGQCSQGSLVLHTKICT